MKVEWRNILPPGYKNGHHDVIFLSIDLKVPMKLPYTISHKPVKFQWNSLKNKDPTKIRKKSCLTFDLKCMSTEIAKILSHQYFPIM